YGELSMCSAYRRAERRGGVEGCVEHAERTALERDDTAERGVDARRSELAQRPDLDGITGEVSGEGDGIDPEVVESSAGEIWPAVPAVLVEHREAEVGLDHHDVADL